MKTRNLIAIVLLAGTALFVGCQSVDNRIKKNPAAFAQLDAATQDKVKQGIIDIGFNEDAVYMALGAPDQKRDTANEKGRTTTWIYNTYYDRYDGTRFAGYQRNLYYDPYLKTYRVYYRPVYADTYRTEKEERIRVVFKEGKVASLEQTKEG
jgi:outer membrane protein assembly factor BamE (lipoprotein component of BamABCDE complex)